MSEQVAIVETDGDIKATFALMKQLRPHLEEQIYLGGFRICNSLAKVFIC